MGVSHRLQKTARSTISSKEGKYEPTLRLISGEGGTVNESSASFGCAKERNSKEITRDRVHNCARAHANLSSTLLRKCAASFQKASFGQLFIAFYGISHAAHLSFSLFLSCSRINLLIKLLPRETRAKCYHPKTQGPIIILDGHDT